MSPGPGSGVEVDVAVIGAGIVGLACASALARRGRSVVVLERHDAIARETTSRNSEVVHAGIYYPAGSLKARLCVEGRRALERRCERDRVPYRRLGKWIVATSEAEVTTLDELLARGRGNGVEGLELRDAAALARAEPAVRAVAALWSPATGIVDAHALALSHQAEAEAHGALCLLSRRVQRIERAPGAAGWRLEVVSPDGSEWLASAVLVNCAGLCADEIASAAGVDIEAERLRQYPCKGDYFQIAAAASPGLTSLVYPVPAGAGLGVHATLDLAGRVRFGPDTEYVEEPRYDVSPAKAAAFARAIQRYLPQVRAEDLSPDYAGVRPKLAGPGDAFRDFEVREESAAGCPGLVNCVGIESPGLTAAEAIAERVAELSGSV